MFGPAWLNPAFAHNYMILKEKGLLLLKQSGENLGGTPVSSGIGS
ncbi:MAG TPA: hypothetical protein VMH01_09825 [Puia sp.]|nr:hypothetical protein [Puia sp.]